MTDEPQKWSGSCIKGSNKQKYKLEECVDYILGILPIIQFGSFLLSRLKYGVQNISFNFP
jgi:hypothetical protein